MQADILRLHMSRPDEARFVTRQIFRTEIDLKPDETTRVLEVSLHNLTNNSLDRLAQILCDKLNEAETVFPGTNLRVFYELASPYMH